MLSTKNFHNSDKNKKPLVSIITVVHNGDVHLERTLLSVVGQSYNNIEYIIIDGGSTDNTLEIIKKYEKQIDYWISEPDNGIYDAMNKGIKAAHGDWILFLGSDDILLDSVHIFVNLITNNQAVYYGNVEFLSTGKLYAGKFNIIKLIRMNMCHQGIFYPKSIFEIALFDIKYKVLADYAFNLRMYSRKDIDFIYIPITIAKYNDKGTSSQTVDEIFRAESQQIIKECYPNLSKLYSFYKLLKDFYQR